MKITYEHHGNEHRAIIDALDDPRYYSKDAIDPEIRGKFREYGRYHGKPVIITHKVKPPYRGMNMDKTFILYGKKRKHDILSTHHYGENRIAIEGLYNGRYADITLTKRIWAEIKKELGITESI